MKSPGSSSRPCRRICRSSSTPLMRPAGAARFCCCSAATTCAVPIPFASSACGLSSTVSSRLTAPFTVTSATPPRARSSRVMPGSASRVSAAWSSASDASVSDITGRSVSEKRLSTGSFISGGRSARFSEIASRMSCCAVPRSFSKTNCVMIVAKPSRASPVTRSTPSIP